MGNGQAPPLDTTFSLTLLQGDGLTGNILGTASGSVVVDPILGAKYYDANFGGGVVLNPGSYTAVISGINGGVLLTPV